MAKTVGEGSIIDMMSVSVPTGKATKADTKSTIKDLPINISPRTTIDGKKAEELVKNNEEVSYNKAIKYFKEGTHDIYSINSLSAEMDGTADLTRIDSENDFDSLSGDDYVAVKKSSMVDAPVEKVTEINLTPKGITRIKNTDVEYTGKLEGFENFPSAYQFTPLSGPAKGGTFTVLKSTPEAVEAGLKEIEKTFSKASPVEKAGISKKPKKELDYSPAAVYNHESTIIDAPPELVEYNNPKTLHYAGTPSELMNTLDMDSQSIDTMYRGVVDKGYDAIQWLDEDGDNYYLRGEPLDLSSYLPEETKPKKKKAKRPTRVKKQKGQSQAAAETLRLAKESELERDADGSISIQTTTKTNTDEINKMLYTNLKNQDPQKTSVYELFQNVVDALAAKRTDKGKVNENIDVSVESERIPQKYRDLELTEKDEGSRVVIEDRGIGMSPDVAYKKYIAIGEKGTKGGDEAGSHAIGKIVYLSYPLEWEITTVGEDPLSSTGYAKTVLGARGDEFLGSIPGAIAFNTAEVEKQETGTKVSFLSPDSEDNWQYDYAINKLTDDIAADLTIDYTDYYGQKKEFKAVSFDKLPSKWNSVDFDWEGTKATIKFVPVPEYGSDDKTKIKWKILNKGVPININTNTFDFTGVGRQDYHVKVNFTNTPEKDLAPNYPYLNNRTILKDPLIAKIKDVVENKLSTENVKVKHKQNKELTDALAFSPDTVFIPFMDKPSQDASLKLIADNQDIFDGFKKVFDAFNQGLQDMGSHIEMAAALIPVNRSTYGEDYIFGFRPHESLGSNKIFINPFSIKQFVEASNSYSDLIQGHGVPEERVLGGIFTKVLVHEFAHVNEMNHGASFTNEMERIFTHLDTLGHFQDIVKEATNVYRGNAERIKQLAEDIDTISETGNTISAFSKDSRRRIIGREPVGEEGTPRSREIGERGEDVIQKQGMIVAKDKSIPHLLSSYLGNKANVIKAGGFDKFLPAVKNYKRLIEPFGGSGIAGTHLAGNTGIKRFLNDLNKSLVDTHKTIKRKHLDVQHKIMDISDRYDAIKKQYPEGGKKAHWEIKKLWKTMSDGTPEGDAAAFVVKNNGSTGLGNAGGQKLIFGGIKSGTPYVWKHKENPFDDVVEQVGDHSKQMRWVNFSEQKASESLSKAGKGDLVYLDPGYVKGESNKRVKAYSHGDENQHNLDTALNFINNDMKDAIDRGAHLIYSNRLNPKIRKALNNIGMKTKTIKITGRIETGGLGKRGELIAYSPKIFPTDKAALLATEEPSDKALRNLARKVQGKTKFDEHDEKVRELIDNYKDWQYEEGDKVTHMSGKQWEVYAQYWSGGKPIYLMQSLDGKQPRMWRFDAHELRDQFKPAKGTPTRDYNPDIIDITDVYKDKEIKDKIAKAKAWPDWKFTSGDLVKSKATGAIFRVQGRYWNNGEDVPVYYLQNIKTGEEARQHDAKDANDYFRKVKPGPKSTTDELTLGMNINPVAAALKVTKSGIELWKDKRPLKSGLGEIGRELRELLLNPEKIMGKHPVGKAIIDSLIRAADSKQGFLHRNLVAYEEATKAIENSKKSRDRVGRALDGQLDPGKLTKNEKKAYDFFKENYEALIAQYARMAAGSEEAYQRILHAVASKTPKQANVKELSPERKEKYDDLKDQGRKIRKGQAYADLPPEKQRRIDALKTQARDILNEEYVNSLPANEKEAFAILSRKVKDYLPHLFIKEELLEIFELELADQQAKLAKSTSNSARTRYKNRINELKAAITNMKGGGLVTYDQLPSSVFFRFFNPRKNKQGYSFDAMKAYEAYLFGIARKMFDEPAVKLIKEHLYDDLPPEMKPYAKSLVDHYMGRDQHRLDKLAGAITSFQWMRTLGLNPRSALVNFSQRLNTIVAAGEKYSALAELKMFKDREWVDKLVEASGIARQVPDVLTEGEMLEGMEKVRAVVGFLFNTIELGNRKHALVAGYLKAKDQGASREEALQAGLAMVDKTQFRYGKLGMPKMFWNPYVRVGMQFSSYTLKQAQFLYDLGEFNKLFGAKKTGIGYNGQILGMKKGEKEKSDTDERPKDEWEWDEETDYTKMKNTHRAAGFMRLLKWIAYATGINYTLQEALDADMSNALGIGVTWGEALKVIRSLGQGDSKAAWRHAKQAVQPGTGILPSGPGPTVSGAMKVINKAITEDKGIDQLGKELTPVMVTRLMQYYDALKKGKNAQGKYTVKGSTGKANYKLTLRQLNQRTFGPKTALEGEIQQQYGIKKGFKIERTSGIQDVMDALVSGDKKAIDKAVNDNIIAVMLLLRSKGTLKKMLEARMLSEEFTKEELQKPDTNFIYQMLRESQEKSGGRQSQVLDN